jgi:hypothetical protein
MHSTEIKANKEETKPTVVYVYSLNMGAVDLNYSLICLSKRKILSGT